MCGIVGGVSDENIALKLVKSLAVIENRGYDNANLVIVDTNQQLHRHECRDRVMQLMSQVTEPPLSGIAGIGNTRWVQGSTDKIGNGNVPEESGDISLVMNGIIENKKHIRDFLEKYKIEYNHKTDADMYENLVSHFIQSGQDLFGAVRSADTRLKGTYSVCVMLRTEPGHLVALRRGSSLTIGLGNNENFIATDHMALLSFTNRFIYLEDGDIADIQKENIVIYNKENQIVTRPVYTLDRRGKTARKGRYNHFMLKDIFDQSDAVLSTLQGRVTEDQVLIESFGKRAPDIFKQIQRVEMLCEGASYHAALVARYWVEEMAGLPCEVVNTGSHRVRGDEVDVNTLMVTLSPSGESPHTLAAFRARKNMGYVSTLSIGNMPESSLARESDFSLLTGEGPETVPTSNKTFTAQLSALYLLSVALGKCHSLESEDEELLVQKLVSTPKYIQKALSLDDEISSLSKSIYKKNKLLFIADDILFPLAQEGAALLSELSRIPAKACSMQKMDQFISMVMDSQVSVIALLNVNQKMNSQLFEIMTQSKNLVLFADESYHLTHVEKAKILKLPFVHRLVSPLMSVIPIQLLAYHVSLLKGEEVDSRYYSNACENTL